MTPDLPERDDDYLRIAEYLEGQCSADDATEIERELLVNPHLHYAAELLRLALPQRSDDSPLDTDAGWADLTRRIDES